MRLLLPVFLLGSLLGCFFIASCEKAAESNSQEVFTAPQDAPNFLFCLADDWSFPHAGVYGDSVAKTPNFDRIAREGILFMNAYTASPSCSPSRAGILTGQEIWRLEEGSLLFGALSDQVPVYTHLLRDKGYAVGYTGKGYGPADLERGGWEENPSGKAYQKMETEVPEGIRATDYAANFEQFMSEKEGSRPFCFWYGASEPHRRYGYGLGAQNGYDLQDIEVPDFLPDTEETRNDVADYYFELEWFDRHLGRMIALLEKQGLLENTVIVVTSDNGMPFPRAKSTLYDYGVHMPLAIRWGKQTAKGQVANSPVSLTDVAPTFLDLAGLPIPDPMTGKSLAPVLMGLQDDGPREFVVTAMERHTICRPNMEGYPMRAYHTKDYTYIHNFESDRWPMGDPDFDAWPQGIYGDIDDGASKQVFLAQPSKWPKLFELSFKKRSERELFHHEKDPFHMDNLAYKTKFLNKTRLMKEKLFDYLQATSDPRMEGLSPWDAYPFAGGKEWEK